MQTHCTGSVMRLNNPSTFRCIFIRAYLPRFSSLRHHTCYETDSRRVFAHLIIKQRLTTPRELRPYVAYLIFMNARLARIICSAIQWGNRKFSQVFTTVTCCYSSCLNRPIAGHRLIYLLLFIMAKQIHRRSHRTQLLVAIYHA